MEAQAASGPLPDDWHTLHQRECGYGRHFYAHCPVPLVSKSVGVGGARRDRTLSLASPALGGDMAVYTEYTPPGKSPAHMSDVVPWRAVVAPGVVLQKDQHGLQRTYALRGPDVQGETPEVQGAGMLQANEVLKRLGGRWMLQS